MRIRARKPCWLSMLLLGVALCGTAVASAEETARADAYANGLGAFERGDVAAALRLWAPPAEQGDPRAQFGLGLIYEEGLGGLPRDEEAALGWYERAARFGLSPAQNNLAGMYAEGRGVARDPARAVALWRQAAAAGFGPAQLNLAFALERGSGVERNVQEAAEWYQRGNAQQLVVARSRGAEAPALAGGRDERPQRQRAPIAIVGNQTPPASPEELHPRSVPRGRCLLRAARILPRSRRRRSFRRRGRAPSRGCAGELATERSNRGPRSEGRVAPRPVRADRGSHARRCAVRRDADPGRSLSRCTRRGGWGYSMILGSMSTPTGA